MCLRHIYHNSACVCMCVCVCASVDVRCFGCLSCAFSGGENAIWKFVSTFCLYESARTTERQLCKMFESLKRHVRCAIYCGCKCLFSSRFSNFMLLHLVSSQYHLGDGSIMFASSTVIVAIYFILVDINLNCFALVFSLHFFSHSISYFRHYTE